MTHDDAAARCRTRVRESSARDSRSIQIWPRGAVPRVLVVVAQGGRGG
eukprot:COSAG06_NODE_249_length_19140_cov_18.998004_9_plen_48_part_00